MPSHSFAVTNLTHCTAAGPWEFVSHKNDILMRKLLASTLCARSKCKHFNQTRAMTTVKLHACHAFRDAVNRLHINNIMSADEKRMWQLEVLLECLEKQKISWQLYIS